MDHLLFVSYLLLKMRAYGLEPEDLLANKDRHWIRSLKTKAFTTTRPPTQKTAERPRSAVSKDPIATLNTSILTRYHAILNKQLRFFEGHGHPRNNQLTDAGLRKEMSRSSLFLKAVFLEMVWSAQSVTKKTIQNLFLFDRSRWLTKKLYRYLERPGLQFRKYRLQQLIFTRKSTDLEEETKLSYCNHLKTQEVNFRQGCRELKALLITVEKKIGLLERL